MRNAVGVQVELPGLREAGLFFSRVYREQLDEVQKQIPRSSWQVQSDLALGVALARIRAILTNDPNSEAGCEVGELVRLVADDSPQLPAVSSVPQEEDFERWASEQLPDLSGQGFFSPLGSATQLLFEGMRLRHLLAGDGAALKGENEWNNLTENWAHG